MEPRKIDIDSWVSHALHDSPRVSGAWPKSPDFTAFDPPGNARKLVKNASQKRAALGCISPVGFSEGSGRARLYTPTCKSAS